MPRPGEVRTLAELGLVSRRTLLKGGAGLAAGAGLATTVGVPPAQAGLNKLAKANARFVRRFTGADLTDRWAAHYVDLCIPVQRADGSLLFIGGDTFVATPPSDTKDWRAPANDWRAPVGLTASPTDPTTSAIEINGAITDTGSHAKGLVPEPHDGNPPTTALPSDVFRVGNTLYMHLMRGPFHKPHHTDFWRSWDNGATWEYLRQWPHDLYENQFQQKTYAADTDDDYVYVMSTIFDREETSGLLLFRVLKSDLDKTDADANASGFGAFYAYQGWGFANGRWAWGNQPTTITDRRLWGEICFRAMDGKYALSWLQPNDNPDLIDIRAQVFPLPTSDLFTTTEQTMVYNSEHNPSSDPRSVSPALYGGFIIPGSTFDNFNIAVSTWIQNGETGQKGEWSNYTVSQWRTRLNPNI
jgi:hypothetical protein